MDAQPPTIRASQLTKKQRAFAEAYLRIGNAAEAYSRISPKTKANRMTLAKAGYALLNHPKVGVYLRQRAETLLERWQVKQDAILAELVKIAFASPTWFSKWTKDSLEIFDSDSIDPMLASAIASVEITETKDGGRQVKLKMHPKAEALRILSTYFKILKPEESGFGSTMQELADAMRSAEQRKAGMLRGIVKEQGPRAVTDGWEWQNGELHGEEP